MEKKDEKKVVKQELNEQELNNVTGGGFFKILFTGSMDDLVDYIQEKISGLIGDDGRRF